MHKIKKTMLAALSHAETMSAAVPGREYRVLDKPHCHALCVSSQLVTESLLSQGYHIAAAYKDGKQTERK